METSEARKRRVENAEAKRLAAERTQLYYDALKPLFKASREKPLFGPYDDVEACPDPDHSKCEEALADAMKPAPLFKRMAGDHDPVVRPEHYTHSRIEVWDAIDAWGLNYFVGAAVKYLARYERKENPVQDLRKAIAYITKEIERREA